MDSIQTNPQQLADIELLKCLQDCPDLNVRDIDILMLLYIYIHVLWLESRVASPSLNNGCYDDKNNLADRIWSIPNSQ